MPDSAERSRNRLLAGLPPEAFALLEPHLKEVDLPVGFVIAESEDRVDTAYFPLDAVISVVAVMLDGRVAEMATIGREGVAGFSWETEEPNVFGRYLVQLPGRLMRMPMRRLQEASEQNATLREHLLRFKEGQLRSSMQLAACNALHAVEARCARWILMTQDRVGSPELRLTQEFLSEMLGVQRTTVTLVTGGLERQGLIRSRRGMIEVTDRSGLAAVACECYGVIERSFGRLDPRNAD